MGPIKNGASPVLIGEPKKSVDFFISVNPTPYKESGPPGVIDKVLVSCLGVRPNLITVSFLSLNPGSGPPGLTFKLYNETSLFSNLSL